ncbi:GNAT family N-acetyltransferase [Apibacter raozihei]|uniref:GNAT family N-acetyltransferase n=1 Tax=Apibacter raozihei TaxID=2500547 RepID=UPI001E4043C3|nr:GNAT family N-acetyltransferase [Apibacter raozihei]
MDRIWFCESDNNIIGSILLMHRSNKTSQLRYFYLEPEWRGIGLGNKLMNLLIDFAHKCGYNSIYLWTTHELNSAHKLYKKFGFKLTEEKFSNDFGKSLIEQRHDLILENEIKNN